MKKILIADSGATKTDWLYVASGVHKFFRTRGFHPSFINPDTEKAELLHELSELQPDQLRFYGTGLGNRESDQVMTAFLKSVFTHAKITVKSDLEGAGKAFFGDGDGAVAVLGTGSVCAKIKGGEVVAKSAALGYAIGDEGSAADLGRRILKAYYRKSLSEETERFIAEKLQGAEYGAMMNRIYRSDTPNRELASIAGDVLNYPLPAEMKELVRAAFQDFIDNQLSRLNLDEDDQIVVTGKVAEEHRELLLRQLTECGYSNADVKYPVIESMLERIDQGSWKL